MSALPFGPVSGPPHDPEGLWPLEAFAQLLRALSEIRDASRAAIERGETDGFDLLTAADSEGHQLLERALACLPTIDAVMQYGRLRIPSSPLAPAVEAAADAVRAWGARWEQIIRQAIEDARAEDARRGVVAGGAAP